MKKPPANVQKRIRDATVLLEIAQRELDVALRELKTVERAQKQMVSREIQEAFDKVSAAKTSLEGVLPPSKKR